MRQLELTPRWDPWMVLLLAAALFLPGLGNHDLWNPDEARYAQVAREMGERGSVFVPYLNGEVYHGKPPLLFWLSRIFGALRGGVDEVAARLPLALSAIGSTLLLFLLARRFFGRRAAWFTAAAYGTSATVLWQGRFGQIDMLLTFLVLSAIACWWTGRAERNAALSSLFFLFTGLATLAKGPAGLIPPLLAVVVHHASAREWGALRQLKILRGLGIWVIVVLAWLLPAAILAGPEYFETMVFKQNVTRYAASWHHLKPWYYYLTVLPRDFFPWSFLLPISVWAGWRHLQGESFRIFRFSIVWILVTLVFFSLSPGKRSVYILTALPPLAIVVGAGLDAWARSSGRFRGVLTWPLVSLALLVLGAAAAIPRVVASRPEVAPLGAELPGQLALLLLALAASLLVSAWGGWKRRPEVVAGAMATGMGGIALVGFLWILPVIDTVKSARPLATTFLALASPDAPYLIYPKIDPAVLYYVGRPATVVEEESELHSFVEESDRVWVMIERDDLAELSQPLPLREVFRDQDLLEGYVLLTTTEPIAGGSALLRR